MATKPLQGHRAYSDDESLPGKASVACEDDESEDGVFEGLDWPPGARKRGFKR